MELTLQYPQIYKAYDIRGFYPEEVNVNTIVPAVAACTDLFPAGKVVVAHDGRYGSSELAVRVKEILKKRAEDTNKKVEVIEVGLATTPMFYFVVNHENAQGGIMVTASHNPKNYNGLKMVTAGAVTISGAEIKEYIEENF